jgi:hypothetical protein
MLLPQLLLRASSADAEAEAEAEAAAPAPPPRLGVAGRANGACGVEDVAAAFRTRPSGSSSSPGVAAWLLPPSTSSEGASRVWQSCQRFSSASEPRHARDLRHLRIYGCGWR